MSTQHDFEHLLYNYIQFVYYETCLSFVVNQNFIFFLKRTSGGKALRTRVGGLKWPKICGRLLWTANPTGYFSNADVILCKRPQSVESIWTFTIDLACDCITTMFVDRGLTGMIISIDS